MKQFLEISGVAVNAAHIESIANLSGAPGSEVHIHFLSGNNQTFKGEDADGLRRVMAEEADPLPPKPKPAPIASAPAGQVTAADVAAAQTKAVIA